MRSRSGTSGANAAMGASGQSKAMGASAANGVRRTLNGAASSGSQRGANGPLSPPRSVNGASTVEDEGLANQVAQVAALTEQVIVASTTSSTPATAHCLATHFAIRSHLSCSFPP